MVYMQSNQKVVGIFHRGLRGDPELTRAVPTSDYPNLFFKKQKMWRVVPETIKEVGNVLIIDRFINIYAFGPNLGEVQRAVMIYSQVK